MKHFGAEAAAATGTKWTGLVSEACSIEVYLFVCVREEREDRERAGCGLASDFVCMCERGAWARGGCWCACYSLDTL